MEFRVDSLEDMCSLMCDNALPKRTKTYDDLLHEYVVVGKCTAETMQEILREGIAIGKAEVIEEVKKTYQLSFDR